MDDAHTTNNTAYILANNKHGQIYTATPSVHRITVYKYNVLHI